MEGLFAGFEGYILLSMLLVTRSGDIEGELARGPGDARGGGAGDSEALC